MVVFVRLFVTAVNQFSVEMDGVRREERREERGEGVVFCPPL
jgi:hypothetical protein